MASAYAAPVSATQVGSYFVQQYYQILQQQPDYTYQFYNDSSSIVRVDGGTSESASAVLDIHTLIMSLNFTAIEIKTINSLESWNGGVLVVVYGSVKSKDFSGWRKFMQTFFLAPQEKGYFVLNDIFHFVNEEANNQAPASVVSEEGPLTQEPVDAEHEFDSQSTSSAPLQGPPVSDYPLEVEAREFETSVHIEGDDRAEDYTFQDHQQEQNSVPETVEEEIPWEEPSPFVHTAEETVLETPPATEEPVGEAPKLTYACILRVPKGTSAPTVSAQPSFAKPTAQHAVQPLNSALPPVMDINEDVPDESSPHQEGLLDPSSTFGPGELKSVYVRNLPSTVSTLEVLEEFKNFGRVKLDGVFIRNRKDIGVCYAFVEFEDVQSAQNAVKASPIKMAGRQVFIEMRKSSIGATSRGGRRGRGGRFGARTPGRGSNQDDGENTRTRSNGFLSTR